MKISIDGQDLFEINDIQLGVIGNDVGPEEVVIEDIKRRIEWAVMHKYEQCLERLKAEYVPILKKKGAQAIPLDDQALADTLMSLPEYSPRWKKQQEELAPVIPVV